MRIVCGTDFTRSSIDAGLVAAAFARRVQGKVVLAHALDISRYKWPPRELLQYLRGSRRTKLALEANRLRLLDTEVEEAFLEGPPASRLAGEVTRADASLVVVGSPSPAGPGGWLIGSVPERLAQDCPVPVLVVRDFQPFETWIQGDRPLEVVVGYDFTDCADAALRWTASLRNFGRCRITVSHVIWPAEAATRLGLPRPANAYDCPPALRERLERELKEKCDEILGRESPGIALTVALGRPDPHLVEIAGSRRADLLVVGTSRRRGLHRLGSVSRGVLRSAPQNVVCVPQAAAERETIHSLRRVERVRVPVDSPAWAIHSVPSA